MKRREFLAGGSSALAAGSISVTVFPAAAGMTATLNVPAGGGQEGGTYQYSEAGGVNQTVTNLTSWSDPRSAFTLSRTRVTNSGLSSLRVEFVRDGSNWASVEFWHGVVGQTPYNLPNGYSVSVSGDFATPSSVSTQYHWWGARWRISGNKTNGLRAGRNDWPYAMTPYATLVSEGLVPAIDPTLMSSPRLQTAVPAYTPMGPAGYLYVWESGGSYRRPDQNLFLRYSGDLLAALAPNATAPFTAALAQSTASVLAMAEASASIPWHQFDATHGCQWEGLVNNAGATVPAPATDTNAYVQIVITGTPNLTFNFTSPEGAAQGSPPHMTDSVNDGYWYLTTYPLTLDATGHLTMLIVSLNGLQPRPVGTAVYVGTGWDPTLPAGITSVVWGDPAAYTSGTPWQIDVGYDPETGYIAYVLWRDPWFLFSVQANCIYNATSTAAYSQAFASMGAMDYRNAVCAVAATPASVPPWLLPRSTMLAQLNRIQSRTISQCVNGTTGAELTFFTVNALGHNANGGVDGPVCDTGESWNGTNWCDQWGHAWWLQAVCLGLLNRPGDTNGQAIAAYLVKGVGARFNGTSGWNQAMNTPLHFALGASPLTAYYTSYGAAWTAQMHYQLTPHGIPSTDATCVQQASPTNLVISDTSTIPSYNTQQGWADFTLFDFAALSLAAQAGITTYNGARDYLRAAAVAYGAFESIHAWKQV